MEWKPIETAPRDGTLILVFRVWGNGQAISAARYSVNDNRGLFEIDGVFDRYEQGAELFDEREATYWMPLPDPPEVKKPE